MIYKISDNIISPLGGTTEANFSAVENGRSALLPYVEKWKISEPFCASLFSDAQTEQYAVEGFTFFESLVIRSVTDALKDIDIPISSSRVVLIISSTKMNIARLDSDEPGYSDDLPGESLRRVADYLGIVNDPVIVCNACISGLSAIITARRLLESGRYDYAVVCGADCQCRFTVSGFQSLKALSPRACRPFDLERLGLNLGEAAATMVLSTFRPDALKEVWQIESGAMHNDAHHISTPSPKGEGSFQCLADVLQGIDPQELAFVNLHGTATMYNDQMESKAIERAGLSGVPVNGYKGYFGHTMGAAGILETIISMKSVEHHTLIATKGFEHRGVSGKMNIVKENSATDKRCFVKLMSGFGGCNAAVFASRAGDPLPGRDQLAEPLRTVEMKSLHQVEITSDGIMLDGKSLPSEGSGRILLSNAYKKFIGGYPRFYKMDLMSRAGFVASELLIQAEGDERFTTHGDRGVVLFNRVSSLIADKEYEKSIRDPKAYFPSPSAFVYTLPNIVTGEIALRNHYHGETSFYIFRTKNEAYMDSIIRSVFSDTETESLIAGWIDCVDEKEINVQLNLFVTIK